MAKIIRSKDIKSSNKTYQPPYGNWYGICSETVDNPKMVMTRTIIPPGGRNRAHYHVNCNAGMYQVKGRRRIFIGPSHDRQEFMAGVGDFIFIPRGEIHGTMNLSDTEPVELITCYCGVSSPEEAQTIYVDPPAE